MRAPSRRAAGLGIGLAVSLAVVAVLLATNLPAGFEGIVSDQMLRWRGIETPRPEIAVCAIDAASIRRFGRWPWPRPRIAELIDGLAAAGAAGIAIDLIFSEPSGGVVAGELSSGGLSREDRRLAEAIAAADSVVLGFYETTCEGRRGDAGRNLSTVRSAVLTSRVDEPLEVPLMECLEASLPELVAAARSQGFVDSPRDFGTLRYASLVRATEAAGRRSYYPSLPMRALERFTGRPLALEGDPWIAGLPRLELGQEPIPIDGRGALPIRYLGPAGTVDTISAGAVLDGGLRAGALAGRLVFVGVTDPGLGDRYATPFDSSVPGVEIHATVASNVLSGHFIHEGHGATLASLLAVLAMGPLVGLLVASVGRRWLGALLSVAVVAAWLPLCYLIFRLADTHLQVVPPVFAGILTLGVALPYQVWVVEARSRQIRRAFSHYVSPGIVEDLLDRLDDVRFGGEERELTVLFCDIRSFTTLSEHATSEQVVELLRSFFTPMTEAVLAAGGTLDKYMGDGMMAFFGAPVPQDDHAQRACAAAVAMAEALDRLNAGRPPGQRLDIGIGLNSGSMAVGNMGSEDIFDYTVIGGEVNVGSRIEALNKQLGTLTLVSGETRRQAPGFLFRSLGPFELKGRAQPVEILELVCRLPAPPPLVERAERFASALAAYRERDFATAGEGFRRLLEDLPKDGPVAYFLARAQACLDAPPPDWDGVERQLSK